MLAGAAFSFFSYSEEPKLKVEILLTFPLLVLLFVNLSC